MTQLDARRYLDLLRHGLVPIARAQAGVCIRCRSGCNVRFRECIPCESGGVVDVLPISMSEHNGPLHERLRNYKDGQRGEQRLEYTLQLAALLKLFLDRHLDCLGGDPDAVVTVRSARRDAPKQIVDRVRWLRPLHVPLTWAGSTDEVRFEAPSELKGRRVLLIDDTFTTGRGITAAFNALTDVGAEVLMPLVIGRHFHPKYVTSRPLDECLSRRKWKLKRCGICKPIDCPDIAGPATLL